LDFRLDIDCHWPVSDYSQSQKKKAQRLIAL